ncbi:MAG: cystathionine gamma-synthase family protein [Burkholderiales bacterium]
MGSIDYMQKNLSGHALHPETLMMGYGYSPALSEGSLKPPIFLTSTFVFQSAQHGKDFFDIASGRRVARPGEKTGLIYSRFNNPNLEMLEDRIAVWDGAEKAAVFSTGMASIATTLLTFLRPGDVLLYSRPIYGGSETLLLNQLTAFGIQAVALEDGIDPACIASSVAKAEKLGPIGVIMVETPGNPTNSLVDLAQIANVANEIATRHGRRPPVIVDNTMLGPVHQKPLKAGADLVVYSLTKYVGGHSDLMAGGLCGPANLVNKVVAMRGALGTQLDPHTCWMLLRSLETLQIRFERSADNALRVATFLRAHPRVVKVLYLGFLDDPAKRAVFERQCVGAGSTFSFEVHGGEAMAFDMLDRLKVCKLAVSLGGTETLLSHPASTTHSGVPKDLRAQSGVTDGLIRVSVGIEHPDDIIGDLAQALA